MHSGDPKVLRTPHTKLANFRYQLLHFLQSRRLCGDMLHTIRFWIFSGWFLQINFWNYSKVSTVDKDDLKSLFYISISTFRYENQLSTKNKYLCYSNYIFIVISNFIKMWCNIYFMYISIATIHCHRAILVWNRRNKYIRSSVRFYLEFHLFYLIMLSY